MINGDQCGSREIVLHLFCSHVTSPQLHLWHSHFFCLGKDCPLLKFFLQNSKTVALVQSDFEFKKGSLVVAKIVQTKFVKSRKNARFRILELMEFFSLYFLLQNPKSTFFYLFLNRKGTVFPLWIFPSVQNWFKPILEIPKY